MDKTIFDEPYSFKKFFYQHFNNIHFNFNRLVTGF